MNPTSLIQHYIFVYGVLLTQCNNTIQKNHWNQLFQLFFDNLTSRAWHHIPAPSLRHRDSDRNLESGRPGIYSRLYWPFGVLAECAQAKACHTRPGRSARLASRLGCPAWHQSWIAFYGEKNVRPSRDLILLISLNRKLQKAFTSPLGMVSVVIRNCWPILMISEWVEWWMEPQLSSG